MAEQPSLFNLKPYLRERRIDPPGRGPHALAAWLDEAIDFSDYDDDDDTPPLHTEQECE